MKAMIFAAGLGTRLRPITDSMPKALVPVGGVPMLERVLLKIRDAGINEVVVNAHHFSGQILDFLEDNGDFGMKISVSLEDEALETGGGIRRAEPFLKGGSRFLVHNADILSDIPLDRLMSADRPYSLATLAVMDAASDRYLLFDDRMRLVGWTNVRTGEVKSPYAGLDPDSCRRYAFCGIHVISDDIFGMMSGWPDKFGIIDFYLSVADRYPIYGEDTGHPKFIDIGTPEKLAEAERLFGRLPKSE